MSVSSKNKPIDLGSIDTPTTPEELYLDLMKKCLTRVLFANPAPPSDHGTGSLVHRLYTRTAHMLRPLYINLMRHAPMAYKPLHTVVDAFQRELRSRRTVDLTLRAEGRDWPADAETMIGLRRLDNIQSCVVETLRQGVPGDLIETGVWRGGATIFMRAILKAYGDTERTVWVADSFQGLPKPNAHRAPDDKGDTHWAFGGFLAVTEEEVKRNFARYGLLDDQVRFLVGWFRDTLPVAPIDQLAVLRLDGDMYESTMDALQALYPKLSIGGYVIIDDYQNLAPCKAAVDTFRDEREITEPIQPIDWTGVYWRRLH